MDISVVSTITIIQYHGYLRINYSQMFVITTLVAMYSNWNVVHFLSLLLSCSNMCMRHAKKPQALFSHLSYHGDGVPIV